jgi:hypothetical protein
VVLPLVESDVVLVFAGMQLEMLLGQGEVIRTPAEAREQQPAEPVS